MLSPTTFVETRNAADRSPNSAERAGPDFMENPENTMEKEAFDLSFKKWFYQLKNDEIRKLLPPNISYTKVGKIAESAAREHFTLEIWANKQLEISE